MPRYLAKRNQDASYSISISAADLAEYAFVDYYEESTGTGFQRWDSVTPKRSKEVATYISRCVQHGLPGRLFELTGNARIEGLEFSPLGDDTNSLGFLSVPDDGGQWLSIIDGGTRLWGVKHALTAGTIDGSYEFDVRLFTNLTIPEEIAIFLLINERQKKVRTDLSLRVVQRALDEGRLTDEQSKILKSVVPDTESWRYDASRIATRLNSDADSPWKGLIQMPVERVTRPIKLQAFWTSLQPILNDGDISTGLKARADNGELRVDDTAVSDTEYLIKVLKNFWAAVAEECPDAHNEPSTTVLWGSIGTACCHIALARIIATVLANEDQPDLTKDRFRAMIRESDVTNYEYWYTRPGSQRSEYPGQKGEATRMTGASNYSRLGKQLEGQWRATTHASKKTTAAIA